MASLPPVMLQSFPGTPGVATSMQSPTMIRPQSGRYPISLRPKKQELSESAATKAGATVGAGLATGKLFLGLPFIQQNIHNNMRLLKMLNPEAMARLSPATKQSAIVVGATLGIALVLGIYAGIGALLGKATSSAYNHFTRKENTRPNYLA